MLTESQRARFNIAIAFLMAGFGYVMGAAKPADEWQWAQFVCGLGLAGLGVLRGLFSETPASAARMDQRIEARAQTLAGEKLTIPPPPED